MGGMKLPAGATADRRHLQFNEDLGCWTVRCNGCGEDLPCDDEFYSRDGKSGRRLGPASLCKACRAERFRNWYSQKGRSMRQARRESAA